MVLWGELRVQATLENLRKVSDFVRDIGRELRLTEEGLDFDLAVEEASANIVRHAYRPITLNSGERAIFFLTQTPGPNRPLLEGTTFTLAGSGPGGLGGNRTIENGQEGA